MVQVKGKHAKAFENSHLVDGESIVAFADGYIGKMMGKGDEKQHNGALIVTDKRVAFYRKGFLGEVLETMPLKLMTSVERLSMLGHRIVRMHTSHDDLEFKLFSKTDEGKIVDAIEKGREAFNKSPIEQKDKSGDGLEKLEKLALLHKNGALSDDEYNEAKAKILAEI